MSPTSVPSDQGSASPGFSGHVVVFTGKLASLGRREACELVRRLGGETDDEVTSRTTMLVVGAGDLARPKTNKLKRAEAVNLRTPGRIRIVSEEDFCDRSRLPTPETLKVRYHSLRRVRDLYPLVRERQLKYLEKWGLIRPVTRTNTDTYVEFSDVGVIKEVSDALMRGCSFRAAVRQRLAARQGQLALNFGAVRGEARPAKVVALGRREARKAVVSCGGAWTDGEGHEAWAARFFLEGAELDEGSAGDRDRARQAYRKALLLDPTLVPAIVNLANLHYASDELIEAQALYGRALALEPDCFEAHFNLGNIHHDLGRFQEAVAYYHDALLLNPRYADAHFYLAVTLEKMGCSADAKAHWRRYRDLAPDGEWVDLAREFSD